MTALNTLLNKVKVIGFDLDDTLWDNGIAINRAIDYQFEHIKKHLPHISNNELEVIYFNRVEQLVAQDPVKYEDMTRLRTESLQRLCDHYQLPHSIAHQAFQCFYQLRQKVQLFSVTKALLELLSRKFKLIAISNGNADLKTIGLAHYFEFCWRAGVDGRAKPSGDMLLKACTKMNIQPQQMLYVGDKLEMDYAAAQSSGCYGVVISSKDLPSDVLRFESLENFHNAIQLHLQ